MWKDNELGIGIPHGVFAGMVDGFEKTLNAAEPDEKKKKILERAAKLNLKSDVQPGTAYYL